MVENCTTAKWFINNMKIPLEWLKEYIHTKKSAKELADSFTNLGLMLDKPIYEYTEDKFKTEILDLEHRMDRSDWLSLLGCARDLSAYEGVKISHPELYEDAPKSLKNSDKIKIEVKCTDLVNRFNTRIFKNIKVKPSPDWLKNRLESYGIPSINNIVDITNYVMVELGQPMHAQDIAKLEKPEIVIRKAKKGENITTLLGEKLELDEEKFVLTQNDTPTVIGGIVGGIATGIDESTTEIILDAGNYNQNNIRKTSRKLKIQNETVLRYDKFLHPDLTEIAIKRAAKLILELAGGEYYENTDWYPNKMPLKKVNFSLSRLKLIGGNLPIKIEFIEKTLDLLEYKTLNQSANKYELEVPYFRTDVEVEDDVVSDILRIYGYPNIPSQKLDIAPPKDINSSIYKFEDALRDICVGLSLHEHITDPLVKTDENNKSQVKLENSQSQLKNGLRTNIYDGLKTVSENYAKHKIDNIKLFEIGKVYSRTGTTKELNDFTELRVTQVYVEYLNLKPKDNSIEIRKILDHLMSKLGVKIYYLNFDNNEVNIIIDGLKCGQLTWNSFYIENEKITKFWNPKNKVVTEFKEVSENDISLMVPDDLKLGKINEVIYEIIKTEEVEKIMILPQSFGDVQNKKKNVVVRIRHYFSDFNVIREKIVNSLKEKLNITVK